MPQNSIKFLAYYLPQYHPIPENDEWWGIGFTEWTNVAKAKPLFKGHYQPILPADLGFYDLRIPEIQEKQSEIAQEYGIDGFIYYQYYFGNGKMLLEKPAEAMLKNPKITIPFCFCWANETWKGIWHGLDNPTVLIEQLYSDERDYINYFNYLLPFFNDDRYIKVDNKPMFHIYRAEDIPKWDVFSNLFNTLAVQNGFEGMHFVATIIEQESSTILEDQSVYGQVGTDIFRNMRYAQEKQTLQERIVKKLRSKLRRALKRPNLLEGRPKPNIVNYSEAVSKLHVAFPHKKYIACVFPNWDNSARSGLKSLVFMNSNPDAWQQHLEKATDELLKNRENPPIILIKSWNEWAEGNHLEPDTKFGFKWLEAVLNVKTKLNSL
jgi:hypothetical protein